MRENEKSQNHGNNEQMRKATANRKPIDTIHEMLQLEHDELRRQVRWINGYLFIVEEHLNGSNTIPAEDALSYLESLPGVIIDAERALNDVAQLAGKLAKALAREVKSAKHAEPPAPRRRSRRAGPSQTSKD